MNIFKALENQLPKEDRQLWQLIVGVPEEGNCDGHFSPRGCDLIDTLATTVYEVDCLLIKRNSMGRIIETQEFQAEVCHEVLDAYHNGTNYKQDSRGDWVINERI